MKNRALSPIILLFFAFFISAVSIAQNNPYGSYYGDDKNNRNSSRRFNRRCTEPFAAKAFNRDYGGLSNANYYHIDKELRDYTKAHCLTADQIRRLALLLPTDREKYDYLTFALIYVFDIENYSLAGTVLANRNARDGFYRFLVREGVPAGDYYTDPYYANNGYYGNNGNMMPPPPQYADRYGNVYGNAYNNNSNAYNNNNSYNNNPNGNRYDNRPNPNDYDYNNNSNRNNTYPNGQVGINTGYRGLMTYKEFEVLKEKIKQNTFEKGKLEAAKNLTRENVLTSNQIAEITRMFSFDTNRLDYAKFAYDFVYDRENYYAIGDAMSFEGNKKELIRFIENHK
jgi:Domain of unknown function (DUF4476)